MVAQVVHCTISGSVLPWTTICTYDLHGCPCLLCRESTSVGAIGTAASPRSFSGPKWDSYGRACGGLALQDGRVWTRPKFECWPAEALEYYATLLELPEILGSRGDLNGGGGTAGVCGN